MFKVVLFVTLVACVFASWNSSDKRREHLQSVHKSEVHHRGGDMGHAGHGNVVAHGPVTHQARGQVESTAHGGCSMHRNKEFKRVKKGQNSKHSDFAKRDNHLHRVHLHKHTKH